MGRPKKLQTETTQPETLPNNNYADVSNQLMLFQSTNCFNELSEIDRKINDNVSIMKDGELLNAIMIYPGANDKEKIMFLFLKYRQIERDIKGL